MIELKKSDKYGCRCYSCSKEFKPEELHVLSVVPDNHISMENTAGYFCNDCLKALAKQILDIL